MFKCIWKRRESALISLVVVVLEVIGGGQQSKVAVDDWPLIQPSEVQVAVPPVLTAEPRLTPLGKCTGTHFYQIL